MKKGMVLRIISLVMFVVAIIFIACALANPALGRTFYIGDIAIGAEVWRVFYAIYAIVMAILFVLSFFVGKPIGGIKAGILKLLIFVPVLVFAFIMGAVLILEFAWWKLIAFMVASVGLGHGKGGIGICLCENVVKMLLFSATARSNDGYGHIF